MMHTTCLDALPISPLCAAILLLHLRQQVLPAVLLAAAVVGPTAWPSLPGMRRLQTGHSNSINRHADLEC